MFFIVSVHSLMILKTKQNKKYTYILMEVILCFLSLLYSLHHFNATKQKILNKEIFSFCLVYLLVCLVFNYS